MSKSWPWKGLRVPVQLVFAGVEVFALGALLGETSVMMNEWTGRKKRKRKSTTQRLTDKDDTEIIKLQEYVETTYSTLVNIKFSVKYFM